MPSQLFLPAAVLIRHAQSEWNREGRFTGWADPELTEQGRAEAVIAAARLAARRYRFDAAYTSGLARAPDTAEIVLHDSGNGSVTLVADWRLNERHYGALEGEYKAAVAARVGGDQVWRWRRGYVEQPPALAGEDPRQPSRDPRWAEVDSAGLPNGESLAGTRDRVMGFWQEEMAPRLRGGGRVLVASHGNTLRALIMALHGVSPAEVEDFEIPTGVPIVYAFSLRGEPIGWHFLQDPTSRAA